MALSITRKTKIILLVVVGIIATGGAYLYHKIFGGPVVKYSDYLPARTKKDTYKIPAPTSQPVKAAAVVYNENPTEGVREAIKQSGGLDFINAGQKVLIKPNVNSDDPAPGTTHPEALAEVVRLVKARGAYVVVGDRSNPRYKTIPAMKKTGMYEAALSAGADEIVGFEDEEWVRIIPESTQYWPKGFRIPKRLPEFDHIISIPVLHTHSITGHSLAIKNMVGLIEPVDRMLFHSSPKIQEMIAEISLVIKPRLTVIDGTKSFISGGPSHGTQVQTKVYLASRDTLAADVLGIALLKKHGALNLKDDIWSIPQVKHYMKLGLSAFSQNQIENEARKI